MIVAHGADVLWITSPNLPALPMLDVQVDVEALHGGLHQQAVVLAAWSAGAHAPVPWQQFSVRKPINAFIASKSGA